MIAAFAHDRAVRTSGVIRNWSAIAALAAGFSLQYAIDDPVREVVGALSPGAAASALGAPLAAVILAAALIALTFWRRLSGRLGTLASGAVIACAAAALILPALANSAPDRFDLALEFTVGAAIYALAAGLILQGARREGRAIGVIGIILFIAQTLYVYSELFGDLLSTSLFFFIGGLVFVAVSLFAARLARRRGSASQPEAAS